MEKHISWLDTEEEELEKRVLAEYSKDEVRKHLKYMEPLARLAGSEEYKALSTSLLRERRKLSDALNLANRILGDTLNRV